MRTRPLGTPPSALLIALALGACGGIPSETNLPGAKDASARFDPRSVVPELPLDRIAPVVLPDGLEPIVKGRVDAIERLVGTGEGLLTAAAPADPGRGDALLAADLDGDAILDLIVATPGTATQLGLVELYLGPVRAGARPALALRGANLDERFADSVAVGDVDADGFSDLAIARAEKIELYRGGRFLDGFSDSSVLGDVVAMGDFDGDRFDDLAVAQPEADRVLVYTARDGALSSAPDAVIESDERTGTFGVTLRVGDIDGDRHDDLFVGDPAHARLGRDKVGRILIYGGGSRIDGEPDAAFVGARAQEQVGLRFTVGDFTGDTIDDLVTRDLDVAGNRVVVRALPGAALLGQVAQLFFLPGLSDGDVTIGDLDGDRVGDLVVADAADQVRVYWGGATLSTGDQDLIPIGQARLLAADLDDDGHRDLVGTRLTDGLLDGPVLRLTQR